MKKVIFYNTTLIKGGTDKYMFDVIQNIDKKLFKVDVIIKDGDVVDEFMYEKLKEMGSEVFLAKGSFKNRILYLSRFFKKHKNEYDVAHINATSEGTGLISFFAKKFGKVKKVIFHSHMGGIDRKKGLIEKVGKILMFKYSDFFASCSTEASKFMFGEKFLNNNEVKILNNSVDVTKFNFDTKIRNQIRKELDLTDEQYVLLHVGRFAKQKNHKLLIEIFNEVVKQNENAVLLLVGDGILFEEIKKQVEDLSLSCKVKFLGLKDNVYDYMQASDCFVMPSLHEGLPIVAVEAQATGLPCVLSNNISKETKLADNVDFVALDASLKDWCETVLKHKNQKRISGQNVLEKHKFDHKTAIKEIEKLYEN